ncbi:hypothetical protein Rsub_09098 [Raphidocelis subcapitata]|uniref:Uncharacterized protein n=1 Tax=Raphidocelis subcapitata TaxID=307507 RepID=A0A2V0PEH5_9CHLO|nr:hypothetical protein Rsub_09098 [Raphidocelis subcapitata]|eukprot:GBF96303.1 hypothetical protein Rsub_09098 [Raphidocelis subcapitata]
MALCRPNSTDGLAAGGNPMSRFGVSAVSLRAPEAAGCVPSDWMCDSDAECCSGLCGYFDDPESGGFLTCW